MMGWYNDGSMGADGWIAMIAMIAMMSLFWAAVIFAGIMIFRGTSRSGRDASPVDGATYRNPVDILDERFARGELENEEYEARKAVLLAQRR